MKTIFYLLLCCCTITLSAQSSVNNIFAAGLEDAERFATDFLSPVSEVAIYNISNGWANTADAKPFGGFEISVIGNITSFKNKEEQQSFVLNTADYQNLQFVDGSTSRPVATALGDLQGIRVFVEGDVLGVTVREEFELPSGLAAEDINFVPSGFLQGSVGIIKGTELKARFLPKIATDDVEIGLYGFGIQHEFTKHLPADKLLPIAISALIGYTHLDGTYDFADTDVISGENQRVEAAIDTWVFEALLSTRLPVINFYGSVGYLSGKSTTDVLGTYIVEGGPFQQTYTDPFSIETDASGVTARLGTKLKLGFFRLHADYTLAEYNTVSFGLNFGFR
ncbi:DUF6588 family protein [Spongiimicrobium salis]|uniref:DUF6588 family protein n=1 Tax=Spongiimicrobium salis TaxID=1667022 RepID=UPI00374D9D24